MAIIFEVIAVVEGEFLARGEVADCDDPNAIIVDERFAIGLATVVEKARRVPLDIAIEIKLVAHRKNEFIMQFAAAQ